jgi:hypothetical protein
MLLRTRQSIFVPWPDMKHHRLNVTATSAPQLDADEQLIQLAFEGTIFDSYLKTTHVELTTTVARKIQFDGSQVFIHQTALASYFYSVYDQIMPYKINDVASSLEIIAEFPEIKKHYGGHGTQVNMSVSVTPASGKFLSVNMDKGISFGKDDDLYVTMELYCSNESQNKLAELCVTFDIKTQVALNVTIKDYKLYLMITDAQLDSVQITQDAVGMKDREYQRVLQHILNYGIANFNFVQQEPIDLNTVHVLVPVAKEFVALYVSPFVQEEFLFIGFDALSGVVPVFPNATSIMKQQLFAM